MNYAATAKCPNGHDFPLGYCSRIARRFIFWTGVCGSAGYDEFEGRSVLECCDCGARFSAVPCPQCQVMVPVSQFDKKGFRAKIG